MKKTTTLSTETILSRQETIKQALAERKKHIENHFRNVASLYDRHSLVDYDKYCKSCDMLDIKPLEKSIYQAHIGDYTHCKTELIDLRGLTEYGDEVNITRTISLRYFDADILPDED